MNATILTQDMKRLIKATEGFLSSGNTRPILEYIELSFDAETQKVKASALDGYKGSVEYASCDTDESFKVYIKPRLPVKARCEFTKIHKVNNTCLIDIGGEMTGFKQPTFSKGNEFMDVEKFINEKKERPVEYSIVFNPKKFQDAFKSICMNDDRAGVDLFFGGKIDPVIIEHDTGKRIVLPMRKR